MDPEEHEAFVLLLAKHERGLRAQIRSGVASSSDISEVLQEVSLIAWRKFSSLENPVDNFGRWASVIARYEVLKFRRSRARDRLVLSEDVVELLQAEAEVQVDQREKELEDLELCMERLPDERRELLMRVYVHKETSIKEVASQLGKTSTALYELLRRLRQELVSCVEERRLHQS